MADLGGQGEDGYLSADQGSLAADGSRWVTAAAGWNVMLDFETGQVHRLLRGRFPLFASWSPEGKAVALWSITKPGITVFDRAGTRIAELPVDAKKRSVILHDDGTLSLNGVRKSKTNPGRAQARITTLGADGEVTGEVLCDLPEGFPARSTGVLNVSDGRFRVGASVGVQQGTFRYAEFDIEAGKQVYDFTFSALDAYVSDMVDTGSYVTGISGGASRLYVIDPKTSTVTPISQVYPYVGQSGYENHATAVLATKMILSPKTAQQRQ